MSEEVELHGPFGNTARRRDTDIMGMYVFLAAELMLFGGLFVVIFVYRLLYSVEFVAASKQLHVWIGATNTAVLLASSFAVALAVEASGKARSHRAAIALGCAVGLGLIFLAIKGYEYRKEYLEGLLPLWQSGTRLSSPEHRLFMDIYLIATALHAVHVAIGIGLFSVLICRCARQPSRPGQAIAVEATGLYWHLVDVIWIFLYPALYLMR